MNLNEFKNFSADRMSLDELVALAAYGRLLQAEYDLHQVDEPDFVAVQLKALKREIHVRNADKLEARLAELKTRKDALKTPTERKAEINSEITKLQRKLQEVA